LHNSLEGVLTKNATTNIYQLGLEQIDLYLIHDPRALDKGAEGVWRDFEKIKEDGLAK
jgi:diketogulonate reductase-like aldo/keto reductase